MLVVLLAKGGGGVGGQHWDPFVGPTLGESVYVLEFQESYKTLCCTRFGKK